MQYLKSLVAVLMATFYVPLALAAGASGTWTTIDDKTGAKRAIVSVNAGNTMSATIVKVFSQAGDTGICSKCPGAFKDKKIQGLRFMWGLKKVSDTEWSGGKILDPKTGKIYNAKATLEGNTLKVRAYVGMSILGRTQTWVK